MKQVGTSGNRTLMWSSIVLSFLVALTSLAGILEPETYARETRSWWAQCVGQDWANLLFTVPALLVSAVMVRRGSRGAWFVWMGVLFTNSYSFALYCFAVHFNYLFLVYCAILGLGNVMLLASLWSWRATDFGDWFESGLPRRTVGGFCIGLTVVFAALWLADALPAVLVNRVPASVTEAGLLTNPVHVLDFSLYLPLLALAGILLWRRDALGCLLAPVMLVFCTCTGLNIMSLMTVSTLHDIGGSLFVAAGFGFLALVCAGFLTLLLRHVRLK